MLSGHNTHDSVGVATSTCSRRSPATPRPVARAAVLPCCLPAAAWTDTPGSQQPPNLDPARHYDVYTDGSEWTPPSGSGFAPGRRPRSLRVVGVDQRDSVGAGGGGFAVYDRETSKEVLHYWSYAGDYVHNVMCEWGIALVAAVYLRRELGVRHVQFYTDLDMIPRSMAGAAAKFGVPVVTASGTPAPHITHISDPRLRAMSDDLIAIAREYDSFTVAHVRGHAGVREKCG
eukprot:COSAG01_NODE_15573_length_1322_cov_2.153720_2_plen_231_part_00